MIHLTFPPNRRTRMMGWLFKIMIARQMTAAAGDKSLAKMRAVSARYGLPMPHGARCIPASMSGIAAEWIETPESHPNRVVFYLHGGGYVNSSQKMHAPMIARTASALRARGFSVDYPLAPEHPYPAALECAVTAYRLLLDQGITADQMVLAGDSAGGGLAIALLVMLRDAGLPLPRAALLFSPWVDLTMTHSRNCAHADQDIILNGDLLGMMRDMYVGAHACDDPLISPLYADLRGLPPIYIQASDREILIDEITMLTERLTAAGTQVQTEVYPNVWHVWQLYPPVMVRETGAAMEAVRRWSDRLWGE